MQFPDGNSFSLTVRIKAENISFLSTLEKLSSDLTDQRIGFRVFFRKEMNSRSKNSFSCNNNRTDRRRNTMINFAIFAIMMPLNLLFLVIDWIVLNF